MADEVLQLVNLERAAIGVPPVEANATLEKIAGRYACRMVSDAFFGHEDPRTGHGPGERAVADGFGQPPSAVLDDLLADLAPFLKDGVPRDDITILLIHRAITPP